MRKRNNKLNIYLSDEEKDKLNYKSKKYKLSNSELIRIFINNNFEEDRFKLQEAKQILEDNIKLLTELHKDFEKFGMTNYSDRALYNINESKNILSKL